MEQTELDVDDLHLSDYCNEKRLHKYAAEYSLTWMGVKEGLWFYHDVKAVCGEKEPGKSFSTMPGGPYASVILSDPFSFSAWRAWTYVAGWMREQGISIRPCMIHGAEVPYYVKLHGQGSLEWMTVYVPIQWPKDKEGKP